MDKTQFEKRYSQDKEHFTPFLLNALISGVSREKDSDNYTEIRDITRTLIENIDQFSDSDKDRLIEVVTEAVYNRDWVDSSLFI